MVYNDYVEPISARRMHKVFLLQNGRDSSPKVGNGDTSVILHNFIV